MLKHLFKLRVRMICTSLDIVISELITKSLIKLLQDLTQSNCIEFDKMKESKKIPSHISIPLYQIRYAQCIRLLNKGIALFSKIPQPASKIPLLFQQK